MTIQEDLSRIGKSLMFEEPFYGLFLLTLNKVAAAEKKDEGITKNGINYQLSVNPEYWAGLNDNQKIQYLKHEILHMAFYHVADRKDFGDKKVFDLAADLEVNQYCNRTKVPKDWVHIDQFPELNLPPRAGLRGYYDILYANKQQPQVMQFLQGREEGERRGTGHEGWGQFDDQSQEENELNRRQFEYQMKNVVDNIKDRGMIPSEFKSLIDKLYEVKEPIFDWKAYFRRFIGSSLKIYTKKSRRKVNKRFFGLPAIKIKTKNHVLVAVDTSGSVSDKELMEFFSEIYHMWKTGVCITIAQCDADIHDISEYKGKFDGRITGRGGTNFQPVIDYFNEHKEYNALVFLTDGYCSKPTSPRKPMMWVMSSRSQPLNTFQDWPGAKLKING